MKNARCCAGRRESWVDYPQHGRSMLGLHWVAALRTRGPLGFAEPHGLDAFSGTRLNSRMDCTE